MTKSQVMPWNKVVMCEDCDKPHRIGECEFNFDWSPVILSRPTGRVVVVFKPSRAMRRKIAAAGGLR